MPERKPVRVTRTLSRSAYALAAVTGAAVLALAALGAALDAGDAPTAADAAGNAFAAAGLLLLAALLLDALRVRRRLAHRRVRKLDAPREGVS